MVKITSKGDISVWDCRDTVA